MSALAEIQEGLARDLPMNQGDRLHDNAGAADEGLGLSPGLRAKLAFDDHKELDVIRHADATNVSFVDELREFGGFWFAVEDGDHRRRVEDHFGKPSSP